MTMKAYKQSFVVVMESGRIIKWKGKAEDTRQGEGLAIAYAISKTGEQVWDIANHPVHGL
jgi:hypothetical protein